MSEIAKQPIPTKDILEDYFSTMKKVLKCAFVIKLTGKNYTHTKRRLGNNYSK